MEVQGYDSGRNKLVRIFPSAIKPQLPDLPEVSVKTNVIATVGGNLNLECHIESLVPVKVKWYKDGQIQSTIEYKQSSKSVLPVNNISQKSAGNYTCWSSNIAGTSIKNIHVTLAEPPTVFVTTEIEHRVNEPTTISCHVQSDLPYNVKWSRKIGDRSSGIHDEIVTSSEKTPDMNQQYDYTIEELKVEDEGWYTCSASNKGGSTHRQTYIKVLSPPILEDFTQIKFTNKISLVVTCKLLRADPTARIVWERKDAPIKAEHRVVEGNEYNKFTYQLIIHKPDKTDEGFYRCIATNNMGKDVKTVRVSYISEPKIKADQEKVFVKVGLAATLKCSLLDGIPPAKISWLKNGIEMKNSSNVKVTDNGAALTITDTRDEDMSKYVCLARNDAGHDGATIELDLAEEPKVISPSSNIYRALEFGGFLEIPCKAIGNPPPHITWMKKSDGYDYYDDVLKIQDATLDNEGEYTCEAKNQYGKDEKTINITITGLEKPTINGRGVVTYIKGLVGQRVELPCVLLSGNPIPNITWFKDGIRLSPNMYNNIILQNGSFVIHLLTLRHVGNYECKAQNVVGEDRKQYYLSHYDAPKMNMSIGSFVLAKVATNVTLPCHSRGDPQPVVSWHKENIMSDKPSRGIRVNGSDNLYIINVAEEDSGRYVCKAENIAGIARKAIVLSVISAPKILSFPKETSAMSGDTVFLSCQAQGTPRPTIRWMKQNQPLLRVRGSIGNNYLRFFADPSDAGEYTCVAENKAGEDRASTYLMILEPPKIDQASDIQIEGILGQNIELTCQVSGTPKPFVIWQHRGQTIQKIIPSSDSSVNLRINNLTEDHKGLYICIASNKAGTSRKKIELSVLVPPKIEDWDGPIKVVPGDTVTIACRVSGSPKPTIKWEKNGHNLPQEFFTHDNILRFIVESSHSGNYTCIAKNKAGNDTRDINLSVYEAPNFLLEPSEDLEILQGSDVKLVCSARGDPKPVISWFYNGRILDNKNKVRFFQDKDSLLISKVDEEDEGLYECAATNKAGSNSRSIKINVLVPPNIKKWTDDMSVREGNEVILSCEVEGKPDPNIVWKKNGIALPSDLSYRGNKIRFIATATDQGNYSCHASNKVGIDVKSTLLAVKVHPQIIGNHEEELVVLWGESLELECNATGVPTPTLSWNFNSTHLTNLPNAAFQLKGWNLFMPEVDFHNAGLYVCSATNPLGTVQKTFQVTVHVAPTITDDSLETIVLNEGDDFSTTCSAYGVPTPDIFWIHNDNTFKKGYHDEHYVVMTDYTLLMSNVKLNMSGKYVCFAMNTEGSTMKNYTIEVLVTAKSLKPEMGNMTLVEIEESDDGVLNCPVTTDSPVHWLKDDEAVDLSGNERADDIHLQLLDGGKSLKLAEAYSSDSGVYRCFTDHGLTLEFLVTVLVRPHFIEEFPVQEFELKRGDQLILDCTAAGKPIPKINWRHVEMDIPVTKHSVPGVLVKGDNKETLHFPSIKIEHAGRYMCLATNKVGKEGRVFTIKVTEPPMLIGEREHKITAISGNTLDLECDISGSPKPRFTWKHISSTGKESGLRNNQKMLMINNLSSRDGGIYVCNGTNKVGYTVKYFFVFVLEAPRIEGSDLEEIHLPEGKEMEVVCEAFGVPPPSLIWQFNSRPIDISRAIVTSTKPQTNGTQTSTLRIKAIDQSVAGEYVCLASNDVASTQKIFRLSIIMPPVLSDQSFLFNNRSVDFNEGQAVYLACPVKQDRAIEVKWFLTVDHNRQLLRKQNNGNLYISSAHQNDSGLYTCVANNSAGYIEASFIINISVPPVFVSNLYDKFLTLNQDDELILNCSVDSKPLSQIVWLKDGVRIMGKKNDNLSLLNHNQTLIISDIKAADSGKYICIASNPAGSAERSFQVNAQEAPKIEGVMSGQVSMISNKTETHFNRVILRCPLTGSPPPTIEWYKDGSKLTGNEGVHITPQGGKVIIFHLSEEYAGHYSCRAHNQAGINQLFFNLKVTVPLEWSQWTVWSNCSKACDNGIQFRNRTCGKEQPLRYRENSYIEYDETACKGDNSEIRFCNTHPCKIDGGWGVWSDWSSCSASCGHGSRTRARRCDNPAPAFGGARCVGSHMDMSSCSRPACPVNGQWSSWSEWSECTVSCGGGLKFRERRCNSPAPRDGGKQCPGPYRDVVVCNQNKCPIDGKWSNWGVWSTCSTTCGAGTQVRYRLCYRPMHGGLHCTGSNKQLRNCEIQPCGDRAIAEALHRSERDMDDSEQTIGGHLQHSKFENYSTTEVEHFSRTVNNSETEDDRMKLVSEQENKIAYLTGAAPVLVESPGSAGLQEHSYYFSNSSSVFYPNINISSRGGNLSHSHDVYIFKDEFNSSDKNTSRQNIWSDVLMNSEEVRTHFKIIKCPTGFRHNKTSNYCEDINECKYKKWNRCNKSRSRCINTIGSYKCVCARGYKLVEDGHKKKCIDINECAEKEALCSHFCHNTRGSYKCSCPDGLTLLEDTHTCLKDTSDYYDSQITKSTSVSDDNLEVYFDESISYKTDVSVGPNKLDSGYQMDSEGTRDNKLDIICPKGFLKNGDVCKDINECSLGIHNCTSEQVCINTLGIYKCYDAPCPHDFDLVPSIMSCQRNCTSEDKQCDHETKIAETISYETFDTENKTISKLEDILLLVAYDENKGFINETTYTISSNEEDLPVDIRKENNLGLLYATDNFYIKNIQRLNIQSITLQQGNNSILYSNQFIVFIYNSFTEN